MMDQGQREELESGLIVRADLLRKLSESDADPRLRDLLAETERTLSALSFGGDSPARDTSPAGSFLPEVAGVAA